MKKGLISEMRRMRELMSRLCEGVNDWDIDDWDEINGLKESKGNYETWYRGYDSKYGSDNTHLVWLTDDISYARAYGNRVEEVVIDADKANSVSVSDIVDMFDYYDGPSKRQARELLGDGYNCYYFHANNDESYCMCLWDKSPIVSRRELSRDEFEDIEEYEGYDNSPYDDEF